MSTYIWAAYQEEPSWPPSEQAPKANRAYVQGFSIPPNIDGPIWIVDYEGAVPSAQDIWDSQHLSG